jgi:hypothetical protein
MPGAQGALGCAIVAPVIVVSGDPNVRQGNQIAAWLQRLDGLRHVA